MVGGKEEGVEALPHLRVLGQRVDRVPPQQEPRPALRQHQVQSTIGAGLNPMLSALSQQAVDPEPQTEEKVLQEP